VCIVSVITTPDGLEHLTIEITVMVATIY